jgi:hypothetical protein
MISRLENLLVALHKYFSKSPKRHLALEKLSELLQTKGGKILRRVKTRWINSLEPMKRVLSEYRILLIKMYGDLQEKKCANQGAATNYKNLADIRNLLSLAVVIPLLECVRDLVVFVQSQNVYICDFTKALSLCCENISTLYLGDMAFRSDAFQTFNSLCRMNYESIPLRWQPDLNDYCEHLVFEAHVGTDVGAHLNATLFDPDTGLQSFVTYASWIRVIAEVKANVHSKLSFPSLLVALSFIGGFAFIRCALFHSSLVVGFACSEDLARVVAVLDFPDLQLHPVYPVLSCKNFCFSGFATRCKDIVFGGLANGY